jgi:hypothetical protein
VIDVCTCAGPMSNTHVDGNEGHSPGCPANPHTHPQYLDDDGNEGVQFVRHDLAASGDGAKLYIIQQGLYDTREQVDALQVDVVWMAPQDDTNAFAEAWYDVVPEAEGVVRYWRLRP